MMEDLVGERSPLHGRSTRELRIAPLSPAAVAAITAAPSAADAIDRYLVVGGFPLLAGSWPRSASLRDFLEEALADDQTPFATTALRIMASELERELQVARAIEAIEPAKIGFIGSIKWHEREPFAAAELRELASSRDRVPGAAEAKLVAVSRTGVEDGVAAGAAFGPDDLIAAW